MKNERTLKKLNHRGSFVKGIIKGPLMALSISLIAICIFAFILRFCDISSAAIKPINQVIKIGSILVGTIYGLKKNHELGLISGFLIGIIYVIISFIVFSLLNGSILFSSSLINDLIFGGIAGAIAGVIAVNFKKK